MYDPAVGICGDLVSGPAGGERFGNGVIDVDLRALNKRQSLWFTHTKYWRLNKDGTATKTVEALRDALDLPGDRL